MIKYIAKQTGSSIFGVDFQKEEFDELNPSSMIDYMYLIPEDGELNITNNDGSKKVMTAKKNNILLKMYSASNNYSDKEFIVLDCAGSAELADYCRRLKEFTDNQCKCKTTCDDCKYIPEGC